MLARRQRDGRRPDLAAPHRGRRIAQHVAVIDVYRHRIVRRRVEPVGAGERHNQLPRPRHEHIGVRTFHTDDERTLIFSRRGGDRHRVGGGRHNGLAHIGRGVRETVHGMKSLSVAMFIGNDRRCHRIRNGLALDRHHAVGIHGAVARHGRICICRRRKAAGDPLPFTIARLAINGECGGGAVGVPAQRDRRAVLRRRQLRGTHRIPVKRRGRPTEYLKLGQLAIPGGVGRIDKEEIPEGRWAERFKLLP